MMKNKFKKIFSIFMVLTLLFMQSMVVAYAADENTIQTSSETMSQSRSTLHKTNGTYSTGGYAEFTTITTRTCYEIKAMGHTYTGTSKKVHIVVYSGSVVVAEKTNLYLNGSEYSLTLYFPYNVSIPADTYTVRVYVEETNKDYDIATFIYY